MTGFVSAGQAQSLVGNPGLASSGHDPMSRFRRFLRWHHMPFRIILVGGAATTYTQEHNRDKDNGTVSEAGLSRGSCPTLNTTSQEQKSSS